MLKIKNLFIDHVEKDEIGRILIYINFFCSEYSFWFDGVSVDIGLESRLCVYENEGMTNDSRFKGKYLKKIWHEIVDRKIVILLSDDQVLCVYAVPSTYLISDQVVEIFSKNVFPEKWEKIFLEIDDEHSGFQEVF